MKKILALLGLAACSLGYAQGTLVVNNYSIYDFEGYFIATNPAAPDCYPYVTSGDPSVIIVPADSHVGNGKALVYDNYREQFVKSLYPMTSWNVTLSSVSPITPRLWSHGAVAPNGTVANNTRWSATKFRTFLPGTTNQAPGGFGGPIALANSCYNVPSSFTTSLGNTAEIFTVTSGSTSTTFIQLY
ncbi:MAG: hypothetical protein LBE92_10645 [Chryseobacterium sp.]|jgi:hypothetical protein|uniref:hypothetical protein n=1 Tax=Chryseobacterium sp. TaxID=1871047 RepID=UPI00281F3C61|nr:hypothetical protein [Chryseobacterium sp.]MDR2236574.1 hypothetical protein [Chryseobacterium sp.]